MWCTLSKISQGQKLGVSLLVVMICTIYSPGCHPSVRCWLGDRNGIRLQKLDVGGDELTGALHDL